MGEPTVAVGPDGAVAVASYEVGLGGRPGSARLRLFTSTNRGASWTKDGVGGKFEIDSLGPVDDTSPLGPTQGIASTPNGFLVSATVGGRLVQGAGGSDVVLVRLERR